MINLLKQKLDNFTNYNDISKIATKNGNYLDTFDCGFLKNDLAMIYNTLYDLSVPSRILCVISCCIGFIGEIAVYFYLLSMYHYDKNIFREGNFNNNNRNEFNSDLSSRNEFYEKTNPRNMKNNNRALDFKLFGQQI